MMNILEYIEMLMDGGMSEEDACRCANVMYNDDGWDDDESQDVYYEEYSEEDYDE